MKPNIRKQMFINPDIMIAIAIFGIIVAIAIPPLTKSLAEHGHSKLWAVLAVPGAILVIIGPAWCKDKISDWRESRRKKTDD